MFFDEVGVEAIVTGGNGRVGGEDDFAGDTRNGIVEIDAFFLHAGADGFEDGESAVAFVKVKDAGGDADGLKSAEATDAEQQFLADAGAGVAAVEAGGEEAVIGRIVVDIGIEKKEVAAADFDAPDFGVNGASASVDVDDNRTAGFSDGNFHGKLGDVGLQVFFLLPAIAIEALTEISLTVKEADADEGDGEIGGAFDVISSEHAEAAGINREGFVDAEFGRKISDGARAEDAGVAGSPSAVGAEIFLKTVISVVDAAVEDKFGGAGFQLGEGKFAEQRNRILVELAPALGIEVAEEAGGIVIPTPPQTASQGPETFLSGSDEAVEGAGFADDGGDLGSGFGEQANVIFAESTRGDGLNDQNSLEDAAVDEGDAEEGLIGVFSGFAKVFEAGMVLGLLDGDGAQLLGDETGEAFVDRQAEDADALAAEADGGGENEVGAVRFEQISGANLGFKALGNQSDDVVQGFGGLAAIRAQIRDVFEGKGGRDLTRMTSGDHIWRVGVMLL
jgi:hypothetical protein